MEHKHKIQTQEQYKKFIRENIPFYRWVRWMDIQRKTEKSQFYIKTCLKYGKENHLIRVKNTTLSELNPRFAPTSVKGRKKIKLYQAIVKRTWVKCMLCEEKYKTTRVKGILVCHNCRKTQNWLNRVNYKIKKESIPIDSLDNHKV